MASRQQPRTGAQGRATKAQRKEQARREREEILRRQARARRTRALVIGGVVVVAVAVVAVLALTSDDGSKPDETRAEPLPGLITGPTPWSANLATLADRLALLDLPPFASPLAVHLHTHVDLSINGSPVPVPANTGFGPDAQAAVHTHGADGVVHLESSQADATVTLGDFFDVWGLRLTATCIGGYCNSADAQLRAFVDGKPFDGNPRDIELTDREEIVVAYGTSDQVPDPLPTFDWSTLEP